MSANDAKISLDLHEEKEEQDQNESYQTHARHGHARRRLRGTARLGRLRGRDG